MADDIRAFRFNTGEYAVAKFIGETKGVFIVQDPLLFEIGQKNEKDQVSVRIQPLIPVAEVGSKCTIYLKDIQLFIEEPNAIIIDTFKNATSPIDMPNAEGPVTLK